MHGVWWRRKVFCARRRLLLCLRRFIVDIWGHQYDSNDVHTMRSGATLRRHIIGRYLLGRHLLRRGHRRVSPLR